LLQRKAAVTNSKTIFTTHEQLATELGTAREVVSRLLKQLEESREGGESTNLDENIKKLNAPKMQLSIFDAHSATFDEIRNLLEAVDINRLTPVEALLKLQEIKSKVK